METHMTSVERILEYAKLEPEKSTISKSEKSGPEKVKFSRKAANQKLAEILQGNASHKEKTFSGEVSVKDFKFNYYDGGPTILKSISLEIQP